MVNQYLDSHPIDSPIPSRQDRFELHTQSLRDTHFAVHLLHDCLLGHKTLPSIVLEMSIEGFLDNFDAQVDEKEGDEERTTRREKLETWLSDYYPPPVIRSQVVQQLEDARVVALLSDGIKRRLLGWVKAVRDIASSTTATTPTTPTPSDNNNIERLQVLLQRVEELLMME